MPDFTFKRGERLKSRKVIEQLFKRGQSFAQYPLRIVWVEMEEWRSEFPAQFALSVSKKKFKRAVDRNRIRRLVREAYRLNKHVLYEGLEEGRIGGVEDGKIGRWEDGKIGGVEDGKIGRWEDGRQGERDEKRTANSEQQTANSEQQTANSEQQTANSEQQTANSKQRTANSEQRTANSEQPDRLDGHLHRFGDFAF